MELLLDDINITKQIRSNVVEYLNRPREIMKPFQDGTYALCEYNGDTLFNSQVFIKRVKETYSALGEVYPVLKDTISTNHDIQTYTDCANTNMTVNTILTKDGDIVIISLEEIEDVTLPQYGYWMGLAFTGNGDSLASVLSTFNIDLTKALTNKIREPLSPPDGFDDSVPLIANVEKVCVDAGELPCELGILATFLIKEPNLNSYSLNDSELNLLTFEDMYYKIPNTNASLLSYRDCNKANITNVIVYQHVTHQMINHLTLHYTPDTNNILIRHDSQLDTLTASVKEELY